MAFSLVALNGDQPGNVLRLREDQPCTLGRDVSCALQLDDPQVSRFHAKVWFENGGWHVRDCESSNGTRVNHHSVDEVSLQPGDLIRVGKQWLVFCEEQETNDNSQLAGVAQRGCRVFSARSLADNAAAFVGADAAQRQLGQLVQLAKQIHQLDDEKALIRHVMGTLRNALGADVVKLSMPAGNGRLQTVTLPAPAGTRETPQVLASWILKRGEALVLELNDNPDAPPAGRPVAGRDEANWRPGDRPSKTELARRRFTAIGVPIPGGQSPRASLECYHQSDDGGGIECLDYVIAVARLCGAAWDNIKHRDRLQAEASPSVSLAMAPPAIAGNDRPMPHGDKDILGASPQIALLLEQIQRVAPADATVLVLGESGTGKELVARRIHEQSSRSQRPFVAVNCAAFTESLLESELFGHEKGAFTGADAQRIGQFERADRGTIFLDEVGELSAGCQAKLLRLLEGQPFHRVGGMTPVQVDVRIVAATHRNLMEMVSRGEFREDLWYRLRVIELRTPPLRERGHDVVALAEHFLSDCRHKSGPAEFAPDAIDALLRHPWPGNVRELRNAVERAVVLGAEHRIRARDLALLSAEQECDNTPQTLAENEQQHIHRVLAMVNGNKTEACRILGIGRATLYSKLSRHKA
ncbi:MAG: sigma 54-interacting transcriptional regulator [Planctomycetales bacterium]|nr:sigma 54-interacting transcriptional regulator [Planctomycetales bacterium]